MINGSKGRVAAENQLDKLLAKITSKDERRNISRELYDKFNIAPDVVNDLFVLRKDTKELSNFELFAILWFLDRDNLSKWYTQEEISQFSSTKEESKEIKLPLELEMVQISDNQWIGKTSLQQLMGFRNSHMINYRENAQRVFRVVKSAGIETLRISINNKAVEEITEALKNNRYIPDDITLNMPEEGSKFRYENGKLTISELPGGKFDITDGYHRYLAMCAIYNVDKSFDYPMELRITNFDLATCQQMIFQKDQKTQMKKEDSATFDQYDMGNQIVNALMKDTNCNVYNLIGRSNANINMGLLSALITKYYVPTYVKKEEEAILRVKVKKDLVTKFNILTDHNTDLLAEKWSSKLLHVSIAVFADTEIKAEQIPATIEYVANKISDDDVFELSRNGLRRKAITLIEEGIKEWKKGHVVQ